MADKKKKKSRTLCVVQVHQRETDSLLCVPGSHCAFIPRIKAGRGDRTIVKHSDKSQVHLLSGPGAVVNWLSALGHDSSFG